MSAASALSPWLGRRKYAVLVGDVRAKLQELPSGAFRCCVTSPPYWGLRDYGVDGQIGLEPTPETWVRSLVEVFREVGRVLADDGTVWLNCGDAYWGGGRGGNPDESSHRKQSTNTGSFIAPMNWAQDCGLKSKDLIGLPWRLAFALQADGWYLRTEIIWHKPNPMPESVRDRPTRAHEYLFLLAKNDRYFYDADAIAEPGVSCLSKPDANGSTISGGAYGRSVLGDAIPEKQRRRDKQRGHSRRHAGFNDRWDEMERSEQCGRMRNKRSVWTIAKRPFHEAHFATFPEALIEPCILAGSAPGDAVLDCFSGSGTTGAVACRLGRTYVGTELNPEYAAMSERRIRKALAPQTSRDDRATESELFTGGGA